MPSSRGMQLLRRGGQVLDQAPPPRASVRRPCEREAQRQLDPLEVGRVDEHLDVVAATDQLIDPADVVGMAVGADDPLQLVDRTSHPSEVPVEHPARSDHAGVDEREALLGDQEGVRPAASGSGARQPRPPWPGDCRLARRIGRATASVRPPLRSRAPFRGFGRLGLYSQARCSSSCPAWGTPTSGRSELSSRSSSASTRSSRRSRLSPMTSSAAVPPCFANDFASASATSWCRSSCAPTAPRRTPPTRR